MENRSRYLHCRLGRSSGGVKRATRPKTSRLRGKFEGRRCTNLTDYTYIHINDVHIGMAYVIFKPSARDYVPLLCTRLGRVLSLSTATLSQSPQPLELIVARCENNYCSSLASRASHDN